MSARLGRVLAAAAGILAAVDAPRAQTADSLAPTREGFLREALDAAPTARTPRFNDYAPGSYHAEKLDLAVGLPAEARRLGRPLQGLVVLGPVGPLWAYYVVTLAGEGEAVRVNSLVMPHARITGKATGLVARREAEALLGDLVASPLLRRLADTTALRAAASGPHGDLAYDLLVVRFTEDGSPEYYTAALGGAGTAAAERERLLARLTGVLRRLEQTYPAAGRR